MKAEERQQLFKAGESYLKDIEQKLKMMSKENSKMYDRIIQIPTELMIELVEGQEVKFN